MPIVGYYQHNSSVKPKGVVQRRIGHPLTKSLIGTWLVNEGAGLTLYDYSGRNIHGTVNVLTSSGWVKEKYGPALFFDTSTGYISIDTGTISSANGYTLSCLLKDPDDGYIYDQSNRFILSMGSSVAGDNIGWYDGSWQSFGAARQSGWHRYTVTITAGGTATLYIDGIKAGSALSVTLKDLGGTQTFFSRFNGGAPHQNAYLNDITLWSRSLSANEVLAHYIDPYILFHHPRPYFLPDAGGGTTVTINSFTTTLTQQSITDLLHKQIALNKGTITITQQSLEFLLHKAVSISKFTETITQQDAQALLHKAVEVSKFTETIAQQNIVSDFNFVVDINKFTTTISQKGLAVIVDGIAAALEGIGQGKIGGGKIGFGKIGRDRLNYGFERTEE